MKVKTPFKLLAAFVALATFAAACGSSSKSDSSKGDGGATSSPTSGKAAAADFKALGGWDDGACKTSEPKVVIGIQNPVDVAVVVFFGEGRQVGGFDFRELAAYLLGGPGEHDSPALHHVHAVCHFERLTNVLPWHVVCRLRSTSRSVGVWCVPRTDASSMLAEQSVATPEMA